MKLATACVSFVWMLHWRWSSFLVDICVRVKVVQGKSGPALCAEKQLKIL